MASINKLLIQGIRSFGPDERDTQVVKFFRPLTLIVGQNGAGKTTIIECLRYATTGEMPPGSKGKAFIHDPKLAHEQSVKARVKLQFQDISGDLVVCTRILEASVKKKDIQVKTIETSLCRKDKETGLVESINSRCTDIGLAMIDYLGVSKAILQNVIFCHQEDSCWPISEGKVLKAKFDDIFASSRYVKALDSIRKFRIEQTTQIKLYNTDIKYLKENKEKAAEMQDTLRRTEARLMATKDSVKKINQDLKPIEKKIDDIQKKENDIVKVQKHIEALKSKQTEKERHYEDLKSKISKVFQGSAEELKRIYNKQKDSVIEKQGLLKNNQSKLAKIIENISQLGESKSTLLVDLGKLEQATKHHQKQVLRRDLLIKEIADEFGFDGFSRLPFSENQIGLFMENLIKEAEKQQKDAKRKKEDYEEKESAIQKNIHEMRDRKSKLEQEGKLKSEMREKNRKELEHIAQSLAMMEEYTQKLKSIEEDLKSSQAELNQAESANNIDQLKREVKDIQERKQQNSQQLLQINKEFSIMTQESNARTEVEMLTKQRKEKEELVRKHHSKCETDVIELLGHFPSEDMRGQLAQVKKERSEEMDKLQPLIQKAHKELSMKEAQRKLQMEESKKKEEEVRNFQERLFEVCGSQDFEKELKECQEHLNKLQDEKGAMNGSHLFFRRYVDSLSKQGACCPLCHRGFDHQQEMQEIKQELNNKIDKIPASLSKKTREIEKQQQKVDTMVEMKPELAKMNNQEQMNISRLKAKLGQLNSDIETLRSRIEKNEEQHKKLQFDIDIAREIDPEFIMIERYNADIRGLDKKIAEKSAKLSRVNAGRSIQIVTAEKQDLELQVETLSRQLDNKRQQIDDQSYQLQEIRSRVNSLMEEKLRITSNLQQRQQMEAQKAELLSANGELERQIQEATSAFRPLQRKLDALTKQKQNIIAIKESELDVHRKKEEDINRRMDNVKTYCDEIQRYLKSGTEKSLESYKDQLKDIEKDIGEMEEKKGSVSKGIDRIKEDLANQQMEERKLEDNMDLKKLEEEIKVVKQEVEVEEEKLGGLDYRTVIRDKRELLIQHDELTRERSRSEGRLGELEEKVRSQKRELNSEMFKNADEKYREKMIDLRTTEMANTDLDKYYKALDMAINKYHATKMDEINKTIDELWRKTYKGNDIDTIRIQSEDEDGSGASKQRRTYNYRVVMVKGDVALDMRGRCSAGQKVLSSLIIRLALADSFCVNCGILALDEPTTNLDKENVESLASSLADLIQERSQQRNFQLVVITHDEEFVQILCRGEFVEKYYRVFKNNSQLSTIHVKNVRGTVERDQNLLD